MLIARPAGRGAHRYEHADAALHPRYVGDIRVKSGIM